MTVDSLKGLWEQADRQKRVLMVAVPLAVIALVGLGVGLAVSMGGGSTTEAVIAPTGDAASATPAGSPTPAILPTETPASAGAQASDERPPGYTGAGGGTAQQQSGTGPGSAVDTGMSIEIPAIGVNASVYGRSVGTNGVMGNPRGAWDVILYDFDTAGWQGLGGSPGQPGANAVFAGHVDYIGIGPAVFWSIRDLNPGDRITVNTPNGPISYVIQWSQWAEPDTDFTQFVTRTGQESITLVTCIGGFSAGHYSNRLIVRGVRA